MARWLQTGGEHDDLWERRAFDARQNDDAQGRTERSNKWHGEKTLVEVENDPADHESGMSFRVSRSRHAR